MKKKVQRKSTQKMLDWRNAIEEIDFSKIPTTFYFGIHFINMFIFIIIY